MVRRSPVILIDTREKNPLVFSGLKTRRAKLDTGDYSVYGFSKIVTVEYKSLSDFLLWINPSKPKRYKSQVSRLVKIHHSCIVVGGRINSRSKFSRMSIETVLEKVAQLSAINIPIIFASNRRVAAKFIETYLRMIVNDY